MDNLKVNGDNCHNHLFKSIKPKLLYNEAVDYSDWKKKVKQAFVDILGDLPEKRVPPNINIISTAENDTYTELEFTYDSEETVAVPAHLLIPKKAVKPCPVVICLQGHTTGMHISLGRFKYPGDEKNIQSAHALRAVENGFAALVIEQRGMGVRTTVETRRNPARRCDFTSYTALLLGRTVVGERVWDVSCAIDALHEFEAIDTSKIICLGNSGGGTTTYYAAAYDERIKLAVPSCSICSYLDSIGDIIHCSCNYLPGAFKQFDMGELACLIAPRKLLVVAGKKDPIFPIGGVDKVVSVMEKIYKKENAIANLHYMKTEEAHYFCTDLIWPKVAEIVAAGI